MSIGPEGRRTLPKDRGALEHYVNNSRLVPFTKGRPTNAYILQIVDDQGAKQPFLVKIPLLSRQRAMDTMEEYHRKYREKLGNEFVEDITRVTVTNPDRLRTLRMSLNLSDTPTQLDGFVQDLRGINGMTDLWAYLILNQGNIEPTTQRTIATFLTRMLTGIREGYGFDLGHFPAGLTEENTTSRLKNSNLIIDDKGIAVIDTGHLTIDNPPDKVELMRAIAFDAARLGTRLLTGQITQADVDLAQDARERPGRMAGITQESIESETPELLSRLSAIQ